MKITIYNPDATVFKEVILLDGSMMTNGIREDHDVTLCFSSEEELAIPEGAYVTFNGETFVAKSKSKMEMSHTRSYTYTIKMSGAPSVLSSVRLRNPADGKLSFPYTASAHDHLALIVSNMNRYGGGGWSVGDCIDRGDKFFQYNYISCRDALDSLADAYGTEWEIVGKTISLHKVEYNLDSPLELSYGKGSGLRPGIIRDNVQTPITRLYTQGGSKNIDASEYGSTILLLPKSVTFKYDGNKFEDEQGFDETKARIYSTDSEGTYIKSHKNEGRDVNEGVIDCTDIYPNKLHTVLEVESGDNPRDIVLDIDENLDYSQYQIAGEVPTITFQSGELMGKTFEIRRDQGGVIMVSKKYSEQGSFVGWKLTLSGTFESGRWLPDTQSGLVPAAGDTCRIFGVMMPSQYISNNDTKSGASWDMLRRGIMYLYEYEDYIYSLKMPVDPIWARANWSSVGSKFVAGGYVRYSNSGWAQGGVVMRIKTIRQDISRPYSIEISLSNGIVGGGVLKGLSDSISNQAGSISEQQDAQKKLEYSVSSLNGNYVTLDTEQTITAKKTFAGDVVLGGQKQDGSFAKVYIPSTAGAGLFHLVMDASSAVDGETPTKAGLDEDELWSILGGSGTEQISKSHLPSDTVYSASLAQALTPYATQEWVSGRGYLTSVKLSTISDLDAGWDSMLAAAPAAYVSRWPMFSEVTERPDTVAGYGITDAYTKGEVNAELSKYVTLATQQTISGDKTHSGDVIFGAAKADGGYGRMYIPSTAGAGLFYLVMDAASPVDGETPTAGGGGLDEEELWSILGGSGTEQISKSHLPSDTVYGDGLAQTLLPYATQEWTAGQYVKKSGDTMSGNLIVSGAAFYRKMSNDTSSAAGGLGWKKAADDTTVASVAYFNVRKAIYINSHTDEVDDLWQDAVGKYTLFVGVNDLTYNTYPILRSDNIGSYALTPSNYTSYLDSRYVNVSGDTMTGPLALPSITGSYSLKIGTFAGVQCDSTFGIVLQYESTFINVTNSGLKRNNSYTIWDSGNDGSGSGLDADTLDGVHNGSVTAAILASRGRETAITGKPDVYGMQMFEVYMNGYPCGYGNGLRFKGATSNGCGELLLGWGGSNNGIEHIYYRNNRDMAETWSEWRTLAFTTDNVASATKLQTARSLWGNSFDGGQNLTGRIWAYNGINIGSLDDYGWYISGAENRIAAGAKVARNVNVGSLLVSNAWADYTKVPTNGIYSKGNILSAGNIIAYSSSSRLVKDILPKRTTFSQRLTALGSVVEFRYNGLIDRDRDIHTGLLYENVRDIMPSMCYMHEGYGALNYLDTDYINLIAGSVQEHTDEIAHLKNKVASLEMEVERLRRGLAA